jgi:hypothetical protein
VESREWLIGIIGERLYDLLRILANTPSKHPYQQELELLYKEMLLEIEHLESIPIGKRMHLQFRHRY